MEDSNRKKKKESNELANISLICYVLRCSTYNIDYQQNIGSAV